MRRIVAMRTFGESMRRTVARSPGPAIVWPRMSKPTPTLPTEAGANAVASVLIGSIKAPGSGWAYKFNISMDTAGLVRLGRLFSRHSGDCARRERRANGGAGPE